MHRKQDSDLFPTDTELERTLRSLRKTKSVTPQKYPRIFIIILLYILGMN